MVQNQVLHSGAKVDSLIGSANCVHMYPHSGLSQCARRKCACIYKKEEGSGRREKCTCLVELQLSSVKCCLYSSKPLSHKPGSSHWWLLNQRSKCCQFFLKKRVNIDLMTAASICWCEWLPLLLPTLLSLLISLSLWCCMRVCREYPCHCIHPPATLTLVVKTHSLVTDLSLSSQCACILFYNIWTSEGWGQVLIISVVETDGEELSCSSVRWAQSHTGIYWDT